MTTLAQYRNMLRINKHRLDDELEVQAQVQYEIGSTVAQLHAKLTSVEATLVKQAQRDNPSLSSTALEALIKRDSERALARLEHEEWTALYDAWRSRGYSLTTLADLHGQQYFAIDSTNGRAVMRETQRDTLRQQVQSSPKRTYNPHAGGDLGMISDAINPPKAVPPSARRRIG